MQIIDGTVLTNRQNRQERPNGRYLLPKCCQNSNPAATGLIVWNQPSILLQARFKIRSEHENAGRLPASQS